MSVGEVEVQVGGMKRAPCLERCVWNSFDGYITKAEECFDVLLHLAVDSTSSSNEDFNTTVNRHIYYYRKGNREGFLLYIVEDTKGKKGHADSRIATIQYCDLKSL